MFDIVTTKKCPHCGEFALELSQTLGDLDEFWFCEECGTFYTEDEIEEIENGNRPEGPELH